MKSFEPNWEKWIPWYLTVASTVVLYFIADFLLDNIDWFVTSMQASTAWSYDGYQVQMYHLHNSLIKRSIGFFAGFSALFVGLAVSFYTVKEQTKLSAKDTSSLSMTLATNSPGIVAMVLGVVLIVTSITSKDSFSKYMPQVFAESLTKQELLSLDKQEVEEFQPPAMTTIPKTKSGFNRE